MVPSKQHRFPHRRPPMTSLPLQPRHTSRASRMGSIKLRGLNSRRKRKENKALLIQRNQNVYISMWPPSFRHGSKSILTPCKNVMTRYYIFKHSIDIEIQHRG